MEKFNEKYASSEEIRAYIESQMYNAAKDETGLLYVELARLEDVALKAAKIEEAIADEEEQERIFDNSQFGLGA